MHLSIWYPITDDVAEPILIYKFKSAQPNPRVKTSPIWSGFFAWECKSAWESVFIAKKSTPCQSIRRQWKPTLASTLLMDLFMEAFIEMKIFKQQKLQNPKHLLIGQRKF